MKSCCLVFSLLLSFSTQAIAESNEGMAADIESEFKNSRKNMLESEKKRRQVLSKLFHLNRKIRKLAEEKGNLSYSLLVTRSQAKQIAKKIVGLEESISDQKKDLKKKLRAIYKMRGKGYISALFSSANPREMERNVRFLSIIAEKDYEMIRAFRENKKELLVTKEELQKKVRKLVGLEKKVEKSEKELYVEQKNKSKILQEAEEEKGWYVSQIKRLRKKSKEIEIDEQSLLSQRLFFEAKGSLHWPVDQIIVQKYGLLQLESSNVQINHKGVRFSSGDKSEVKVPFPGRVKFSGKVPGFGNVVVIDHSDHYYTVYGNLRESHVEKGQAVELEEYIADANSKGLYFEIRHYSQPEDPSKWLKVRGLKVSSKTSAHKG